MNTHPRAALAAACLVGVAAAQSYQLTEIAASPGAYATIDQVVLNDQGHVAFTAAPPGSSNAAVFLARTGSPVVIAPGSGTRAFLGVALANGRDPVTAATDRVSGSPPTFFVRKWPPSYVGFPAPVGSSQRGDFNSASGWLDVNDVGFVAFGGLINGSTTTALFAAVNATSPPTPIAIYPGTVGLFPQVAQDNTIVVRDNQQRIVTLRNGTTTVIASAATGFATVGQRPGIASSSDGAWVSFAGSRTGLARGVYVSVPHAGGRTLLTIAGEGSGPVTGVTESERVGLTRSGDMATVVFPGLTAAGSGIYAVDFTVVVENGTPRALTMPPILVAAIGSQVGGRTITTVNLYDQPNNCASVAFRAGFGGTAASAVLAQRILPAPMFTARINFVRVLGPGGTFSPEWSAANVTKLAAYIDVVSRRLYGIALQSGGSATDINDPHAPASWFNVPNLGSVSRMEAFAESNPCDTAWRTDAINVYLVNSIAGAPAKCSFQLGSGATENDILVLSPNVLAGIPSTLAHELGHYFNLRHTHANHEGSFAGCAGGAAGDCIDDVPPDILPDDTRNCEQEDAALAATYPPSSHEYAVLFRNIMSYRCRWALDATATCGQRLRVLKTALQFRSHVLENYPTPVITAVAPATDRYPGASAIALTGNSLPTTGLLQVRLARQGSVVANVIPNGINATFASPIIPGDHCSCVYRDGQLVAFYGGPAVRPHARVSSASARLSLRSLNPNGQLLLAFGSPLPERYTFGGLAYELWVNPNQGTSIVPTDGNAMFSIQLPVDPGLSGLTIAVQALDLSGTAPTFTNDVIVRFP